MSQAMRFCSYSMDVRRTVFRNGRKISKTVGMLRFNEKIYKQPVSSSFEAR